MYQNQQSTTGSNRTMVPEAKQALNNMKFEIANELGINLKQGYNGDLPSRQAGYIGGYMVKRLIENAERVKSDRRSGRDHAAAPFDVLQAFSRCHPAG